MTSATVRSAFNPTLHAPSDVWSRQRPHPDTTDGGFEGRSDLPPPPPPGYRRVAGTTSIVEPIIYEFQPCAPSETEITVGNNTSKSKKKTSPDVDTSGTVPGDCLFTTDTVYVDNTDTLGADQEGASEEDQMPFEDVFKDCVLNVNGDGIIHKSQAFQSFTASHVGSKSAHSIFTSGNISGTPRAQDDSVKELTTIDRTVDFKAERKSAMDSFASVVEDVYYGVRPEESRHFDRVNESLFKLRGFGNGKNTRLTIGGSSPGPNPDEIKEMKETITSYQDQLSARSFENGILTNTNVDLRFKLYDAKSSLQFKEEDLNNTKSALSAYKTFSESLGSAYSDLGQRFTKMSKQWTKCSQTVAPLEAPE